MKYPLLAARLYGTPLMIHPEKAAIIESAFRAFGADEARNSAAQMRQPAPRRDMAISTVAFRAASDKPYAVTESGIAVIEVLGTLVQRASGLDLMSGITSYSGIEAMLAQAEQDPDVKGILLEVDSGGGEANGVFDLADQIRAAGETKPVWAIANEQAYSAAYAIAASAQKLYIPRTGGVGSIGVIALHMDESKRDAIKGVAYTAIHAGARKNDFSSHAPLSGAARNALQTEVSRLYDMFVAGVADGRGIDEQAVRDTEAGLLTPEDAIDGGFADGVATFTEVIGMFDDALRNQATTFYQPGTRLAASLSAQPHQENFMAEQHKPATDPAALPAASAAAAQPATAVDTAALTREAATAERARISAIFGCDEAKGRSKLAQTLAMEMDVSLEQAKKLLAASPVETAAATNAFAAAMSNVTNPKVGAAGGEAAGGEEETADAMARRIASYAQPVARQ